MCPDKELLSSFIDGEVPAPWKERIELHLKSCPSCLSRAEDFCGLKAALLDATSADEARVLDEAAVRIADSIDFGGMGFHGRMGFFGFFSQLWSRRVSLPMPFLAAGAAALVLAGLAFGAFYPLSRRGAMATATRTILPQQVSLESIAQNFKQTSIQPISIDMPAESVFSRYGDPVIMSFDEPSVQEVRNTQAGAK